MNGENHRGPRSRESVSGSDANTPAVHIALKRIGANRWCVIDTRYPADDARCLIGYVERMGQVYHAIRLDASPMLSFDEADLESVLRDLQPHASSHVPQGPSAG
jgi:hypothetical protein